MADESTSGAFRSGASTSGASTTDGPLDATLRYATAAELRGWYSAGTLSPTEYTRAVLDLLDVTQPALHAFLTVTADLAMAQAAEAEKLILADGERAWLERPLLGMPVSVKDLTPTAGVRTTRGSLRYADWTPERDAPAVARLREAGAVLIGKTTTSEFGWSAGTVNRLAPPAANPWDPSRSAGGSSGGAAAAVAAGIGVGALGTDGAGSIRIPAAFCGVVGFKPTFGRVPYVPISPEGLSHIGPLTRDVATAALMAGVIEGAHPDDPSSAGGLVNRTGHDGPVRLGWLRFDGIAAEAAAQAEAQAQAEAEAIARSAVDALGAAVGVEVTDVEMPVPDPYPHLVTILAAFDAAGHAAEYDELSDRDRLAVVAHGRTLTAADLARAWTERLLLAQRLDGVMERVDVLAMPTVWIAPFAVDAWRPVAGPAGTAPPPGSPDLDWLAWCRAAYPFNLTGQPAISLPAGFTGAGLPVGLQLVGRRHEDALVLRVAEQFERARPWRQEYSRKDRP